MKLKSLFLPAFFLGLICLQGCSSSGSESSSLKDELGKTDKTKNRKAGGNTCLLGYAEKLDQLLTGQIAGETTNSDAADAEFEYSKVLSNPVHHSVRYAWKGSRTRMLKIGANEIEVPVKDEVVLHGIASVSTDEFRRSRRNVTDEELAEMNRRIEEALAGKTENEAIKKQLEKLEKLGVDKSTVLGAGSAIGGMAGKVAQSYSEIPGLGDAAAWNSHEQRLYVLDDGVELSVSVNLGDVDLNREKSVVLAKKILDICN